MSGRNGKHAAAYPGLLLLMKSIVGVDTLGMEKSRGGAITVLAGHVGGVVACEVVQRTKRGRNNDTHSGG